MRILVVGGTKFVGRHIVATALTRGHDVTVFHRGQTGDDLFPQATHRHGDRNADLSSLADGSWDATVDVSAYVPRQVHALADALGGRGGRYAYISTVSVYDVPAAPGYAEDSPLITLDDPGTETVTGETYGGLKALCETAARERFGDAVLIVRPTYVVGPWDSTGRFTWWVRRIARGGEVLVPADSPVQVIDGRDLASFTVDLVEAGTGGTFHTVTPPPPFGFHDLLAAIAAEVAPPGTTFTKVDEAFLTDAGVQEGELPLWNGSGPETASGTASPAAALAAGLAPRPLRETIRDTLEHGETCTVEGVGLGGEREADLLVRWHARTP